MSNDKLWQDMTPDKQAHEIHYIKLSLLRLTEGLEKVAEQVAKIAENVKAIEDELATRH